MIKTLIQFLQPAQNFVSKGVLFGRSLPFHKERAAWLQNATLNIFEVREALPVRCRDQLGFGKQLLGQRLAVDPAFLDENGRTALQNLIDASMAKQKADHEITSRPTEK